MSGRIRSIKPEIHDDVPACSLSDAAWRLWVGSWPLADDDGRFKAEPLYLSTRIWMGTPDRDGRPRDAIYAATALLELAHTGFVRLYKSSSGELYGEVKKHAWRAHQRIDRPSKWRNPIPNDADYLGPTLPEPSRLLTDYSTTTPRLLAPTRARAHSGSGPGPGPGGNQGPSLGSGTDEITKPVDGGGPSRACGARMREGPPETPPDKPAGADGGISGMPIAATQLALERADGKPTSSPSKTRKPVKQASTAVKQASGDRFGVRDESELQLAWRCWTETYTGSGRRYGGYTRDPADGKRMVSLAKHGLELARERASELDGADVGHLLESLFRFWFREYMRDDGSKGFALADVRHGLRWLTNVSRYGSPWARAAPQRAPGRVFGSGTISDPSETPQAVLGHPGAEPGAVGAPPEFLEALSRIGRGAPAATPVDLNGRRAELQAQAAALLADDPKAMK